jgi:hypothetical protein
LAILIILGVETAEVHPFNVAVAVIVYDPGLLKINEGVAVVNPVLALLGVTDHEYVVFGTVLKLLGEYAVPGQPLLGKLKLGGFGIK